MCVGGGGGRLVCNEILLLLVIYVLYIYVYRTRDDFQ